MSFWLRLLRTLGIIPPAEKTYYLDDEVIKSLQMLAEQEQSSECDVASDLISSAVSHRQATEDQLARWFSLSPRQQQVAMMVCNNYSTREIAAELTISTNTVKSHIRNVLNEFGMHSRNELRSMMADFDFSRLLKQ